MEKIDDCEYLDIYKLYVAKNKCNDDISKYK